METRINIVKRALLGSRTRRSAAKNPAGGTPLVHHGANEMCGRPPVISLRTVTRFGMATGLLLAIGAIAVPSSAYAAEPTVGLGTVGAYSVLGSQTVTNTGPSTLSGDLGVSPGTAITGFPPGKADGSTHAADAQAAQARSDLTTGYLDAAGRAKTASVAGDLVGKNLTAGVYKSTGPLALSGTLTLNGQGNPDAVFIFQVASTLITASSSHVSLVNDAQACNVFWQVGSSATLGTTSSFDGTIMALTSVTVTTRTVVVGRALARNGAVTLDNDTFLSPACKTSTPPTTTTSTPPTSTKAPGGTTSPGSPVPGANSGGVPTGPGGVVPGGSVGSVLRGHTPLAQTGAGPALEALLITGILLMLLGGLVLVVDRPRARARRL